MAYNLFEEKLKRQGCKKVRIGILQENKIAKKDSVLSIGVK